MMYHYAKCYYDTGIYFEMYPPGPENTDEESGQPIDSLGNTFEYSCEVTGCMEKKKMGGTKAQNLTYFFNLPLAKSWPGVTGGSLQLFSTIHVFFTLQKFIKKS